VNVSYEELIKKVKINLQGIFSEIWKEKIKAQRGSDDSIHRGLEEGWHLRECSGTQTRRQ
jgi:hypothetical protein